MDANTKRFHSQESQGICSDQLTLPDALCKGLHLRAHLLWSDLPEQLYNLVGPPPQMKEHSGSVGFHMKMSFKRHCI